MKVFARLTHASGLGVWPPAKRRMENGRVVTITEEPEVKVQPREDAPIGEERGQIRLEGRGPGEDAARLRAMLANAATGKGPYGLRSQRARVEVERFQGSATASASHPRISIPEHGGLRWHPRARGDRERPVASGQAPRRRRDLLSADAVRQSTITVGRYEPKAASARCASSLCGCSAAMQS